MRTLILNDTRSDQHIGCELVMQNLLRMCGRAGLKPIGTVLNSARDDEAIVLALASEFELLLVNGEGTMHHDRPKARSLCAAASAAARLGKKVVLLNTVWQANQELNKHLRDFDLVFCRESRSQAELAIAGSTATVVPDLVFATDAPTVSGDANRRARGAVVIDSVDRATTLTWAWRALRQRAAMMTMHEGHCRLLQRRPWLHWGIRMRSQKPIECLNAGWASQLRRFERVISGRYHGCCLAMLLGIPTIGIPSNTHKIEGLFADAGLGEAGIWQAQDSAALQQQFATVASRRDCVAEYVARAKGSIAAMFERIAGLAHSQTPIRQAG